MMIDLKESGLENVTEMLATLANLDAQIKGAVWDAYKRKETSLTNKQVLDYLAEGGRSFLPTDADAEAAAGVFVQEVTRQLQIIAAKRAPLRDAESSQAAQQKAEQEGSRRATQAAAKGYREAAKLIAMRLAERVEKSTTSDGGTAKSVTEDYAAQRARKYGIPDDPNQVGRASGQLLDNLLERNAFRLVRG